MGTETYLRVGIDGTAATSGERVVTRSLDNISNSASNAIGSVDRLEKKIASSGNRAPEAAAVVKRTMKEITESVEVAGVSIGTLENMFVRLIARTAMIAGIYQLIGLVKSAVIDSLNYLGQIETAGLSIGASFLSGGKYIDQTTQKALQGSAALRAAQADSANVIDQLRIANLKTAATLDHLIYAYQVTLPEAQNKAFNRDQIMKYTLAMVQAAGAIGLPYAQIAEETRDMLKGAVNSRNTRIATVLGMGPQNAEYMSAVRKGGDELYDYLMKRLEGFRLAGIETQKTWAGLWSNIKDLGKMGGGIAVEPLFESVKKQLKEIQDSVVTIDEATGKITFNETFVQTATEIGKSLGDMFRGFVEGTKFIYEHIDSIKLAAEMYVGYRLTLIASTLAQKAASVVTLESFGIERARQALQVESLASTMRIAQEEAKVAASHLEDAKATATAMFADREAAAAKIALVEADLALIASEKQRTVALIEANAAKIADKIATQESIKLKMEEVAVNSLRNQSLAGPYAQAYQVQLTRAFNSLKTEEANIRRSITQLQIRETALHDALATSIVRESTVTDQLNRAKASQTVLTEHYKAATTQVLVATEANTAAQVKATIATDAHAIATTAASIGTWALTTATNALKAAIGFLGGPIGAVITALGLGATAWAIWGKESRKAVEDAEMGLDGVLKKLKESNRLLEEQARMNKELPKDASPEVVRQTLFTDKQMAEYDASLKRAKDLEAMIQRLGGPVEQTQKSFSTLGGSADSATTRVQILMLELRKERSLEKQVYDEAIKNYQLKKEQEAKYQQTPPKPTTDTKAIAELAAAQKQVQDAWLSYDNAFTNRKIEAQKNETKILQNELSNRHSLLLLSEQEFINQKAALDQRGTAIELKAVEDRRKKLLDILKDKFGVSNVDAMDPNNEKNQPNFQSSGSNKDDKNMDKVRLLRIKEELELRAKVQDSLKETAKLEAEGAISSQNASTATLKNVRDLAKAYSDVSAAIKSATGDSAGAVQTSETYKQGEYIKQISALLSSGPPEGNVVSQIANITKEIEVSNLKIAQSKYEQLKVQIEQVAILLEQEGAIGEATKLRNSIVPLDPSRLGLDNTTKKLQEANMRLKEMKDRFTQVNELQDLLSKNKTDSIQLKADQSKSEGGLGFGAIQDQLDSEKAAIAEKYEAERRGIQQKIDLLEAGHNAEMEGIISVRNATIASQNTIHAQTMASIEAENQARYFNQPALLKQSKEAAIEAENSYQNKLKSSIQKSDKDISDIKVANATHATSIIRALQEALALSFKKETQEGISADQKAFKAKMDMASMYTSMAASMFQELASAQDQSSRQGFQSAKDYNIAAVIMNTATAVMGQLATPGPVGWAMAAAAAIMGAVQIAKVQSTSYGGGGSGSSVSMGSFNSSGGTSSTANMTMVTPTSYYNPAQIGSMRSEAYQSIYDTQTLNALDRLRESVDNASIYMRKMADGLIAFKDMLSGSTPQLTLGNIFGKNITAVGGKGIFENVFYDIRTSINNIFKSFSDSFSLKGDIFGNMFKNIGNLLSGSLGGLSNILLGDGVYRPNGGGVMLGVANGVSNSIGYTTEYKGGGLLTSSDTRVRFDKLDPSIDRMLNNALDQIKSQINLATAILGTTNDFNKAATPTALIKTSGRTTADIQADVESWLAQVGDAFSKTVDGLINYTANGENAYDALVRLTTALQSVNSQFDKIGKTLVESTLAGADRASNMLENLFGGRDNFDKAIDNYFTGMFTQAEQDAITARIARDEVNNRFRELNSILDSTSQLIIPKTREEFRNLVDSLDITTEKGAQLFAALMDLSGAFVTATETSTKAAQQLRDDAVDMALAAANALADITATYNTSPEITYNERLQSFNEAVAAGRNSDIPDLAKELIAASRDYNASGAGFQSDYARVTEILRELSGRTDNDPTLSAALRQEQLLKDIKKAIQDGNMTALAGFSGQLNPDSPLGGAINTEIDLGMMNKAQTILGDDTLSKMIYGLTTPDMKYDLNGDNVLDISDILKWQQIKSGTIKWSDLGLPAFASGTPFVANDMLASIHKGEMVIDSASSDILRRYGIPTTSVADNYESSDNGETVEELREQNRLLKEIIAQLEKSNRLNQAGFTALVEIGDENNQLNRETAQKADLQRAQ